MIRVPGFDAVVEAGFDPGVNFLKPLVRAEDPPVAVGTHNAAKLSVRCGEKYLVAFGPNGYRLPIVLMPEAVHPLVQLGFPYRPFQSREPMTKRLRIIINMRAVTRAPAVRIVGAFPAPEPAVILAQGGRGFQDGQVSGHGF